MLSRRMGHQKIFLMEERAGNFDAVATLTGVDEENIIASMFLNSVGVQKNITKVNRTSLRYWSADFSVLWHQGIAVDTIMHFIRGRYNARYSNLEALHHVANGRISSLQFQIREENKNDGRNLWHNWNWKRCSHRSHYSKRELFSQLEWPSFDRDRIIVTLLINNITKIYDLLEGAMNSMIRYLCRNFFWLKPCSVCADCVVALLNLKNCLLSRIAQLSFSPICNHCSPPC